MFASVGADGSVRMFDLRHLEHSTIIYEDPQHHPLLRLCWNKQDPNYLATMAMDGMEVSTHFRPFDSGTSWYLWKSGPQLVAVSSPEDFWKYLETVLVVQLEGKRTVLVGGGQGNCFTDHSPLHRMTHPGKPGALKLRKPGPEQGPCVEIF